MYIFFVSAESGGTRDRCRSRGKSGREGERETSEMGEILMREAEIQDAHDQHTDMYMQHT